MDVQRVLKQWIAAAPLWLLIVAGSAHAANCPGRLITLGGDITATVFALGAGECIVADDTTSEYPPAAKKLPRVGYLRSLNAEGVLALRPDTIIASEDAGPPTAIRQLRKAGVEVILLPEKHTVDGTITKIKKIAEVLGREQSGKRIVARMGATLDALDKKLGSIGQPKRVIFLLTMGGSPMAGGTDTAANGIIELAGGINAAAGFSGYKPLSAEAMVRLEPDVILVMVESTKTRGGTDFVYGISGVKLTPAGRSHRIYAIDGTLMLGFGPRLGKAATKLAGILYPNLSRKATSTSTVVPAKADGWSGNCEDANFPSFPQTRTAVRGKYATANRPSYRRRPVSSKNNEIPPAGRDTCSYWAPAFAGATVGTMPVQVLTDGAGAR
ncbi:MAG: ABC transporter substrate-binding protein [Gammaproteobacteria bacterium]|nr:ABC transporter substrate-binding protein [Gammaproteobacteria bacterium]